MSLYIEALRQVFPGKPTYTEKDIPDLSGKVYVVTGANTGIGKEVARVLFSKNAAVWVAARNEEKGRDAIRSIREAHPLSTGRLEFLLLDLSDLSTIKKSAESFLAKETQLHVLYNNAGVMMPPQGSKTAQGYELQLGTNCLGHFLFTKLLTPTLVATAKASPKGSVRVIWVSSSAAELLCPVGEGIDMDNLDNTHDIFYAYRYGVSKAGNVYQSTEYARRHREDGIVSLSLNPGNLASELDRYCNPIEMLYRKLTVYPVINGAYTELFAGLSNEVTLDRSGDWIVPWGRFADIRKDILQGSKPQSEGGTGIAQKFWDWNEEQVKAYV
ncbi:short-chain dehydrogenase [Annulohypoxylon maeteangense]|uniref:short-chain dehydrogenase n=1 Tax=Annulohypoxylon maeteangense TaxID=1927788 RepID=UPI0020072AFB|nr:short-chain dehydrogenase [Annulohypoxylon maeteangense]KAI0881984.1 short-chain dehydrogenase [Annulohypoxylon maeteangense]